MPSKKFGCRPKVLIFRQQYSRSRTRLQKMDRFTGFLKDTVCDQHAKFVVYRPVTLIEKPVSGLGQCHTIRRVTRPPTLELLNVGGVEGT